DGNAAQERDVQLRGQLLAAAVAEDVGLVMAVGTYEVAHVLDDAQRGDVELLVHRNRATGIGERHLLRRRDHDRACHRNRLAQAERDIAGAWRHVDDQIVELGPTHFAKKLLEGPVEHRTPPDDRGILAGEKAHRNHLQTVPDCRHDLLSVSRQLCVDAQHDRHVRTVDIAVHHTDLAAALGERERQVDSHRGLSNAALAGSDSDDVLHARQWLTRTLPANRLANPGAHLHVNARNARHAENGGARLVAHLVLDGTRGCRQLDGESDAVAVDPQALDEPQADNVTVEIGVADDLEGFENRRVVDGNGRHIQKDIGFRSPRTRSATLRGLR